jgi:hypothetical protein
MTFNESKLNAAIETAKEKAAGNKALLNAISKAAIGLRGAWIVTELVGKLAITTESGETYFANGVCGCKAFANGMVCKHRVAYRIVALYNEIEETPAPASLDLCPDRRLLPQDEPIHGGRRSAEARKESRLKSEGMRVRSRMPSLTITAW